MERRRRVRRGVIGGREKPKWSHLLNSLGNFRKMVPARRDLRAGC